MLNICTVAKDIAPTNTAGKVVSILELLSTNCSNTCCNTCSNLNFLLGSADRFEWLPGFHNPAEWQEAVVDKEYFDSGQRMRKSKGWSLCSCSSAMERRVLSWQGSLQWEMHIRASCKLLTAAWKTPVSTKTSFHPTVIVGSVKWFITSTPLPLRGQAASPELHLPNWPRTVPHQQNHEVWGILSEEV